MERSYGCNICRLTPEYIVKKDITIKILFIIPTACKSNGVKQYYLSKGLAIFWISLYYEDKFLIQTILVHTWKKLRRLFQWSICGELDIDGTSWSLIYSTRPNQDMLIREHTKPILKVEKKDTLKVNEKLQPRGPLVELSINLVSLFCGLQINKMVKFTEFSCSTTDV